MTGSARVVIVDTCILINLIHVNRLDLFGQMPPYVFVVPEQVVNEVSDPAQACILAEALANGSLHIEASTDPEELKLYADLERTMGRGEAACLAMAQERHCLIACDEKGRFLDEALSRLGKAGILNTPGIFLLAIRKGILTVEEADQMKEMLEKYRFKMKFGSFRDFL